MQNGIRLLPNCLVKKKYFVLQPCNCIARERAGKKYFIAIVLQENGVVGRIVLQAKALYCN